MSENNRSSFPAIEGGIPTRNKMLPFHKASIGDDEIQSVVETLRSGWITTGPKTKLFEKNLADYLEVPRVICVNSCTSALHLSLVLFDIGSGDEVITSPITFPSTANVILHTGADVVFCDIDPMTLNLDLYKLESRITSRTKAIIPVHMAGYPCDMTLLEDICKPRGIRIIQDSAHAIESRWLGKTLPHYGDLSTYSFYATKNITCAEGGALVGLDQEIMDKASLMSLFGISKDAWKRYNLPGYQHWETLAPGYKYNMFDIQASLGVVQLPKINAFRNRRLEIIARYDDAFSNHPCLDGFLYSNDALHAHYLYILKLVTEKLTITRDMFMKALESENIGIGIHFRSLLDQSFYKNKYPYQVKECPAAQDVSGRIVSLPLYPMMTDCDVNDVIGAVLKILNHYKK